MRLNILKEFKRKIFSFDQTSIITKDLIGGECKFIADPFIQYDTSTNLWVLFAEFASPGRRQHIGVLKSKDLRNWEYHGDAVKGSRESFPFIFQHKDCYHMLPCVDATAAPGLVAIYKAQSLLNRWTLEYQFVLRKRVNDRVLLPGVRSNSYYLIYGTRSKSGPAMEYLQIVVDEDKHSISCSRSAVLLRTQLKNYVRNKFLGSPRPVMRPGGSPIQMADGYILPIQGTYTGKYGEALALANITINGKTLKITDIDFLDIKHFCSGWTGCHHLSYFKHDEKEVIAVDGHFESSDWEVRIFTNS